jgi:hypothetical protein
MEYLKYHCKGSLLSLLEFNYRSNLFILGVQDFLKELPKHERLYMDITWFEKKHAILTITIKSHYMIEKNGEWVRGVRCFPVLYAYSEKRDNYTLQIILSVLRAKVEKATGMRWFPKFIHIDFDKDEFSFQIFFGHISSNLPLPSVLAIKEVFPEGTQVVCCYFHLIAAVYKKAKALFDDNAVNVSTEFSKFWLETRKQEEIAGKFEESVFIYSHYFTFDLLSLCRSLRETLKFCFQTKRAQSTSSSTISTISFSRNGTR